MPAIAFAMLAAVHIVPVPLHIPVDDQVEQAVVVQINPCRRARPAAAAHAGLIGYIGKRAVAVVVIQLVAAVAGNEHIFVAIVVVVGDSYAHAVAHALQAGLLRDVLKRAVGLLVVHAVPVLRPGLLRNGSFGCGIGVGCAIHQKQIEPAVIIAIEERHARAHGLNQIFARSVRRPGAENERRPSPSRRRTLPASAACNCVGSDAVRRVAAPRAPDDKTQA